MVSDMIQGLDRDEAEEALTDLDSSMAEWQGNAEQIRQIKDEIDRLRFIEGWDGPAAQEYSRACVVQGNANLTPILKVRRPEFWAAAHGKPVAAAAAQNSRIR